MTCIILLWPIWISDGANWIDAELGRDVEKLVKENYYNVLDVVIIMKTEGFPINGNFKIVSFLWFTE